MKGTKRVKLIAVALVLLLAVGIFAGWSFSQVRGDIGIAATDAAGESVTVTGGTATITFTAAQQPEQPSGVDDGEGNGHNGGGNNIDYSNESISLNVVNQSFEFNKGKNGDKAKIQAAVAAGYTATLNYTLKATGYEDVKGSIALADLVNSEGEKDVKFNNLSVTFEKAQYTLEFTNPKGVDKVTVNEKEVSLDEDDNKISVTYWDVIEVTTKDHYSVEENEFNNTKGISEVTGDVEVNIYPFFDFDIEGPVYTNTNQNHENDWYTSATISAGENFDFDNYTVTAKLGENGTAQEITKENSAEFKASGTVAITVTDKKDNTQTWTKEVKIENVDGTAPVIKTIDGKDPLKVTFDKSGKYTAEISEKDIDEANIAKVEITAKSYTKEMSKKDGVYTYSSKFGDYKRSDISICVIDKAGNTSQEFSGITLVSYDSENYLYSVPVTIDVDKTYWKNETTAMLWDENSTGATEISLTPYSPENAEKDHEYYKFVATKNGNYTINGETYTIKNVDREGPEIGDVEVSHAVKTLKVPVTDNGAGVKAVYLAQLKVTETPITTVEIKDDATDATKITGYKATCTLTIKYTDINNEEQTFTQKFESSKEETEEAAKAAYNAARTNASNYLENEWLIENWSNISTVSLDGNDKNEYEFNLAGDGEYTFVVRAEDKVVVPESDNGNMSDPKVIKSVVVDNTAPVVSNVKVDSLNENDYNTSDKITISATVDEENIDTVTATLYQKATDNGEYKVKEINLTLKDEETKLWQAENIEVDDGYNYYVTVTAVDQAENAISENSAAFNIDNTAPDVDNVKVDSLNEEDYNTSDKITISATVDEKNIDTVTATLYQKATDNGEDKVIKKINLTLKDEETKLWQAEPIEVADGYNYYVTVTAVDQAENAISENSSAFNIDNTYAKISEAPTFTLVDDKNKTQTVDADHTYYGGHVTLSFTVVEENFKSGVLEYTVNGEEKTIDFDNESENFVNKVFSYKFEADGVYQVKSLELTDKANNVTKYTFDSENASVVNENNDAISGYVAHPLPAITVDRTYAKISEPTFTLVEKSKTETKTADKNIDKTDYYGGYVTLSFTVEETNFKSGVLNYTVDNKAAEPLNMTNEALDEKGTFKYTFTNDAVYQLTSLKLTDKAGNVTTYDFVNGTVSVEGYDAYTPNAVVVDRTHPTINVEYNNNDVRNDKYFNAERTVTITVNELNFNNGTSWNETDENSGVYIVCTKDGKKVNNAADKLDFSSWSSSEENSKVHTMTIAYDPDADYVFDVYVIDRAGNYTVYNANTDTKSVSTKDFTVDTTKPGITVTGIANGSAYNGNVGGNVNFNDTNFNGATIKLTRADKNSVYDVTTQHVGATPAGGTGGDVSIANFDRLLANDGIYTLTATAIDMAGNEADPVSVTFSVNRFGSTYQFDDYLSSICDKHITAVTGDLKITEINPDSLSDGSVTITHNGKVIKNDVKAVLQKSGSASGGWYEYLYTISKDKFTEDGLYTIVINSKDAAGNEPSSQNDNTAEIKFWVDDTKSELSGITGLEEAIINGEKQDVTFSISDNIGLKSVVVYCDGKVIATFGEDDFTAGNLKDAVFTIDEASSAQHIRIVAEDQSGNVFDTDEDDTLTFEHDVTVSTNFFVRWFANKPLFFGSIAAIVIIGAGIWFAVAKKKKNED